MKREKIKNQILDLARKYYSCQEVKNKNYIPASGKSIGEEELLNMIEASLDMELTSSRFNNSFEKDFSQKLGTKFALTVNSGSSANLIAISALTSPLLKEKALKKGDEVITVAACFPTTVNPIWQNSLVPVFLDCELDTYNIDISLIEKAITPKTKAIFIAHTLGNMYDVDKIMKICEKKGLWFIEDSCDALGAKFKGKYAGTTGHIGTYSFYPAHHITMGEGGCIVTSNPLLYRIIKSFRDWGRDCWCEPGKDNTCSKRFKMQLGNLPFGYDHKYTYSNIGYNLKITDWQAAIGLAQLKKLDLFLEKRRKNTKILFDGLKEFEDDLILTKSLNACEPSCFGFLIAINPNSKFSRTDLTNYLEENHIGTRNLFAGNILRQPYVIYNDLPLKIEDSDLINSKNLNDFYYKMLPNTEFIMNNVFWVGCAQNLNETDVEYTVNCIKKFLDKSL